jgi:hypothetical protein
MQKLLTLALLVMGTSTTLLAFAQVPEIDPASGGSALALLAGAVLVFRARRSK